MQETSVNLAGPRAGLTQKILLLVAVWFGVVMWAALTGQFQPPAGQPPALLLAAFVTPSLVFVVAYLFSEQIRDWLASLDLRHLVLIHSWRMLGMGFVFLYFHDRLPAVFAIPAGLGDALVAISALLLGISLYEGRLPRRRVLLWNSFGVLDFLVAVSTGVLSRTDGMLYLATQPGSDIMSTFPLAMIPGFAAGLYFATHLMIYLKLRAL